MRTWYLAVLISNTWSFDSNFERKHAVLRRHLEPSPATQKEIRNGIDISIFFNTKQKQAITDHILYGYNSHDQIFLRVDYMYHKISAECLVIGFAYL